MQSGKMSGWTGEVGGAATTGAPSSLLCHRFPAGPYEIQADSHRDQECHSIVHEHIGAVIENSVPEPTFIFLVGQPFNDQGNHLFAITGNRIHQAPAP